MGFLIIDFFREKVGEMKLIRMIEKVPPEFGGGVGGGGIFPGRRIEVYAEPEFPIPHAHILKRGETKNDDNVCVCLFAATYFKHKSGRGEFNSKDRKKFVKAMKTEPQEKDMYKAGMPSDTYWGLLCNAWNNKNPKFKFRVPSEMPDYRHMNTSFSEAMRILHTLALYDFDDNEIKDLLIA